jgi:hypothetical protein
VVVVSANAAIICRIAHCPAPRADTSLDRAAPAGATPPQSLQRVLAVCGSYFPPGKLGETCRAAVVLYPQAGRPGPRPMSTGIEPRTATRTVPASASRRTDRPQIWGLALSEPGVRPLTLTDSSTAPSGPRTTHMTPPEAPKR